MRCFTSAPAASRGIELVRVRRQVAPRRRRRSLGRPDNPPQPVPQILRHPVLKRFPCLVWHGDHALATTDTRPGARCFFPPRAGRRSWGILSGTPGTASRCSDTAAPDGSVPSGTRPSSPDTAITSAKIASASRSSTASITADSATWTGRITTAGSATPSLHSRLVPWSIRGRRPDAGHQAPDAGLGHRSRDANAADVLVEHVAATAPPGWVVRTPRPDRTACQRHPSRADASTPAFGLRRSRQPYGHLRMTAVLSPVGKRDTPNSRVATAPDNSSPHMFGVRLMGTK